MKKVIGLSLLAAIAVQAAPIVLDEIAVEEKIDTEVIKDVSEEEIKSADVAEGLAKTSSSVWLVRRSGISNDVIVRGQKKDNINVTIDGAKVFGACPNRMDPAISHILTNNIDYIEVIEGPYNVEESGVLSADVKVHTKKPDKEFEGEVNLNAGSWGYKKASFSASGGTDTLRFLISASTETGGQYEDGDGNDFAEQIEKQSPGNFEYQDKYRDMDAFEKKTVMAKLFWNIADNQELRLSYTGNRSDDILYPSSKMDALYDDSDIFNIEYTAKDLGKYSKQLDVQLYQSEVDHPMSTLYRKAATDISKEKTHWLDTKMQGARIKNSFDAGIHMITAGLDYSLRNWDGRFYNNGTPIPGAVSLDDVDTENYALFVKDTFMVGNLEWNLGLRYDDTEITSENAMDPDNDYSELNGYISGTYHADENTRYFAGIGKSSRVPDARELYIRMSGKQQGTPTLDNTKNYELDLGMEKQFGNAIFKAKAFYSMLEDFIAYNSDAVGGEHLFENVDATIYGLEFSGSYIANESLSFDYGIAYQRGKKEDPLTGQTDTDLPEIPPLKLNAAVNYLYDDTLNFKAEVIAADEWSNYDKDNGEQELDAYAVLNLKGTKQFNKHFALTIGVDNVFDTTYATANTYKDLTLLGVSSSDDVMLLNEPGRYFYANLKYKF